MGHAAVLTQHVRRDLLQLPDALALMQKAEDLLSAHEHAVASEQVLQLVGRGAPARGAADHGGSGHLEGVPGDRETSASGQLRRAS